MLKKSVLNVVTFLAVFLTGVSVVISQYGYGAASIYCIAEPYEIVGEARCDLINEKQEDYGGDSWTGYGYFYDSGWKTSIECEVEFPNAGLSDTDSDICDGYFDDTGGGGGDPEK